MVRYDREHKRRTRAAIVEAASQAFRRHGVERVGVGEVMARAGLTHGGFYAHFASKDALVAEACASSLRETAGRLFESQDGTGSKRTLPQVIRAYLSRSHRDAPATGCTIAALGDEIARRSPETRHAFTEAAQTYVERLATLLPDGADPDEAWALLAGMAGTVMLARAVDDPALSERLLLAGRRLYGRAFGADVETVPMEGKQ
jgi:TetR/AcrR family transcriptional repressor of nem operon